MKSKREGKKTLSLSQSEENKVRRNIKLYVKKTELRSSFSFKTNKLVTIELGKMKQTPRIKKSLDRVWSRYFQLYGMMSKLIAACENLGWTQMDIKMYAKEHYHLVNQFTANMVRDNEPDVPQQEDLEWLTSHPAVAGTGKALRTQVRAGQKMRRP